MIEREPTFASRVRQLRNCRINGVPVAEFFEPRGFPFGKSLGQVIHAAVADVGCEIEVHAGHFVKKQALTGFGERKRPVFGFSDDVACGQYVDQYADSIGRQAAGAGSFGFGVFRFGNVRQKSCGKRRTNGLKEYRPEGDVLCLVERFDDGLIRFAFDRHRTTPCSDRR